MTCGVDTTISCTNSPGTKPLNVTLTSPPAANELSATRGVLASGKATTTDSAGGATVVGVDGATVVVVVGVIVVVVVGNVVVVGVVVVVVVGVIVVVVVGVIVVVVVGNVVVVVVVVVVVGITDVIVNDRSTSFALRYVESPPWLAVNVHNPALNIVTWKKDTTHTPGVDDTNVTSRSESEVAVTVKGVSENTRSTNALNVIVCVNVDGVSPSIGGTSSHFAYSVT